MPFIFIYHKSQVHDFIYEGGAPNPPLDAGGGAPNPPLDGGPPRPRPIPPIPPRNSGLKLSPAPPLSKRASPPPSRLYDSRSPPSRSRGGPPGPRWSRNLDSPAGLTALRRVAGTISGGK